jgi:hypothetical protein
MPFKRSKPSCSTRTAKHQGEYGYYNYNRHHNSHVEIIAFDKIVIDAKQRHKAFFEKLGIGG